MTSPYPSQGDPYGQQQPGQQPYGQQPPQPDPSQGGYSYELPAAPASGAPGAYPPAYTDPYAQQQDPYTTAYPPQQQPVYQPVPVAVPVPGYSTGGYATAGGYVDPVTGMPISDKSKTTAGLLQIFLGGFGVGRFYTGHIGIAVGQLAVTLVLGCLGFFFILPWCGMGIWGLIDGIVILAGSTATDAQGRLLRR